ncbi:MAG: NAD(P)H-hydrate dehydratase [Bacteroidetes bacterium]|nr:NAD(P)H-hydrate dehydratase [Bacteroidota bacterium]
MFPLFTAKACNKLEKLAEKEFSISTEKLMENAGSQIAEFIKKNNFKNVLIFCGKGNNGGDGLVAARYLSNYKIISTIVFAIPKKELNYLSTYNLNKLSKQIKIYIKPNLKKLSKIKKDLIIDSLLGINYKGELKSNYYKYANWINSQKTPVYSVDVPSGLNATTGKVGNVAIKASNTITLGSQKIGLWINDAPNYTGEINLKEIGSPKSILKKIKPVAFLIDKNDIKKALPKRSKTSNKYTVGKVFALCGSRGLTGAAILASSSSMRAGAGAVILGIPETEYKIVARRILEVMPQSLFSTTEGSLSLKSLNKIIEKLKWCDALLIGPGSSKNIETIKLIQQILKINTKPVIIDADAIFAIRNKKFILKRNSILTPHFGEFKTLLGNKIDFENKNIIELGKKFAKKYSVILVLKGKPTYIFNSNGKVFINPIGNEGMATAGSGDVLSGIIAAFLSQGSKPINAAINGVYVHSLSGDISSKQKSVYGVIASDLIKNLPEAIKNVTS